jgi:hypothetical protein
VIGIVFRIHADGEDADAAQGLPAWAAAIGGWLVVDGFLGRAGVDGSTTADAK